VTEERKSHWENVYTTRAPDRVGWYRPRLDTSLAWTQSLELDADAPIIDVGGGASTLVDDLLHAGFLDLTILDIAEGALELSKARLGEQASKVGWIVADITDATLPPDHFALWHDRAVLHFLTTPEDQQRYRDQLVSALRPGGYLLIGTFAPEAPPTCSGLPVRRYDVDDLAGTLGDGFELLRQQKELHLTPGGVEQMYQYALFRLN
jgi:SAM-dependent methyltransferase